VRTAKSPSAWKTGFKRSALRKASNLAIVNNFYLDVGGGASVLAEDGTPEATVHFLRSARHEESSVWRDQTCR
jgi:hypothetical protein